MSAMNRPAPTLPIVAATPRPPDPAGQTAESSDVWFRCEPCGGRVRARSFRVVDGRLWLSCSACGSQTAAAGDEPQAGRASDEVWVSDDGELLFPRDEGAPVKRMVDPYAPAPGYCAKCISPRGSAASCPTCGVLYTLPTPTNVLPSFYLRKDWKELIAHWDNPASHARIMRAAQARRELGALGRLYRIWLTYFPEDPCALHGRTEVVRLASIPIIVASTVQRQASKSSRATSAAWVLILGLLVGTASLMAIGHRAAARQEPSPQTRVGRRAGDASWSRVP
jgi:hypothetical protein